MIKRFSEISVGEYFTHDRYIYMKESPVSAYCKDLCVSTIFDGDIEIYVLEPNYYA